MARNRQYVTSDGVFTVWVTWVSGVNGAIYWTFVHERFFSGTT
jgi:hypothetical protein